MNKLLPEGECDSSSKDRCSFCKYQHVKSLGLNQRLLLTFFSKQFSFSLICNYLSFRWWATVWWRNYNSYSLYAYSLNVCVLKFSCKGSPLSHCHLHVYLQCVKLLLINNSFHKVTEWTKLTVIDHTAIYKTLGMDCVQYLLYS